VLTIFQRLPRTKVPELHEPLVLTI
jgi:hypothetical protein